MIKVRLLPPHIKPISRWKLIVAAICYILIILFNQFGCERQNRHDPGEPIEPVPPGSEEVSKMSALHI